MSTCPPILPCQITAIQDQMASVLTDTVAISRLTATAADGAGHLKATSGTGWTTVATVAGLLASTRWRQDERLIADQVQSAVDFDIYVLHGTDVTPGDRLLVGSRTFEVQGVGKTGAWAILDRCYCVEFQK